MKAIVQRDYESTDVLELRDVDEPSLGADDVLVRCRAAGVHAGDAVCMRGVPHPVGFVVGWPRPIGYVPGYDVAGIVETVGAKVTRFRTGDEVFGACTGALAELVRAHAAHLALEPNLLGVPARSPRGAAPRRCRRR